MAGDFCGSLLLFVGEGNFSFSSALSSSPEFSSLNCQKLIATDYIPDLENELTLVENSSSDSEESRRSSFSIALLKQNVKTLKSRGHLVLYDVDATKLHEHNQILQLLKSASATNMFVIFNFPHVKSKKMKIGLNRDLLRDFFISCDLLAHHLNDHNFQTTGNDNKSSSFPNNVIPVVSLCAGQSGIDGVESVSRGWGDSWQINDMAAHGNFVCSSICKFTEWYLYSFIFSGGESDSDSKFKSSYQSSYYRLQTGTSFATEKALTFTYQHASHIDPHKTDRLKSLLRFTCQHDQLDEVMKDFVSCFGPVSGEKIVSSSQPQDFHHQLPYHHLVHCQKDVKKIEHYINQSPSESARSVKAYIDKAGNEVKVKTENGDAAQVITVGKLCDEVDVSNANLMALYVDKLLELKYNCSYRLAMCKNVLVNGKVVRKSLYPHIHEFHISFWVIIVDNQEEKNKFTKEAFLQVLLDVYGLMLKALEFVEEYVDDKHPRRSLCWKVKVQSLESALSRLTAHQMYLQLRKELTDRLHVQVR